MIFILIYTLFISLIFIFCIRQRELKNQKTNGGKMKKVVSDKPVINIYMVGIILCLFAVGVLLTFYFKDNTVIQNVRSITIVFVLAVAAYYDWLEFRIPNKLILLGLIQWLIITAYEIVSDNPWWIKNLISELIASLAMLIVCVLCILIIKNGLGMGDIKLLMLMGLIQGLDGAISAIFTSMVIIFFISIFFFFFKKKSKKDVLPFALYILIGTILSICTSGY